MSKVRLYTTRGIHLHITRGICSYPTRGMRLCITSTASPYLQTIKGFEPASCQLELPLESEANACIPCCTIYRSIHKCCVVAMLFVLQIAEDVLSATINAERTETLSYTEVPQSESVCLLNLRCLWRIFRVIVDVHLALQRTCECKRPSTRSVFEV